MSIAIGCLSLEHNCEERALSVFAVGAISCCHMMRVRDNTVLKRTRGQGRGQGQGREGTSPSLMISASLGQFRMWLQQFRTCRLFRPQTKYCMHACMHADPYV